MSSNAQPAQLGAREAAKLAVDWVSEVYADQEEISNVGLEEIELADDGAWHVTVGFSREWSRTVGDDSPFPALSSPFAPRFPLERDYKVVRVDAATGAVRGMEIRTP